MTRRLETHPLAIVTAFSAAGLIALSVLALYIAQAVLIPIAFALVVAFVLWAVVGWMGRVPGLRALPGFVHHAVVLGLFVIAIVLTANTLRSNGEILVQRIPQYSQNIIQLVADLDARFRMDQVIPAGLPGS